jgi:flagellar motor switch protein FliN/FliY
MSAAGRGLAEELVRSLGAAVNRTVKASDQRTGSVSADELPARLAGPSAAFCLELGGVCRGRAAALLSAPLAGTLAGLLKGLEGDKLAAASEAELADQDLEELSAAVGGALAGFAEKLVAAIGESPGLGMGDALLLPADQAGELVSLLGPGPYPLVSFDAEVEELAGGKAAIVFPSSFAEEPPGTADWAEGAAVAPRVAPAGPASEAIARLHPNISRILRLKLPVSVTVAEKDMPVSAVLSLAPGAIIEFNKSADEDLDLRVNDHRIAAGEVVIIGERFGIQLRTIDGLQQRIRKLGDSRP